MSIYLLPLVERLHCQGKTKGLLTLSTPSQSRQAEFVFREGAALLPQCLASPCLLLQGQALSFELALDGQFAAARKVEFQKIQQSQPALIRVKEGGVFMDVKLLHARSLSGLALSLQKHAEVQNQPRQVKAVVGQVTKIQQMCQSEYRKAAQHQAEQQHQWQKQRFKGGLIFYLALFVLAFALGYYCSGPGRQPATVRSKPSSKKRTRSYAYDP